MPVRFLSNAHTLQTYPHGFGHDGGRLSLQDADNDQARGQYQQRDPAPALHSSPSTTADHSSSVRLPTTSRSPLTSRTCPRLSTKTVVGT